MRTNEVLSGLLLVVTALGTASCGGVEAEIRGQFMDGCEGPGASDAVCECAFDKLEGYYGMAGLIAMHEEGIVPPDFGPALVAAGLQCRSGDVDSPLMSSGHEQESRPDEAEVLGEPVVWRDGTPYPQSKVDEWHDSGAPPNQSQLEAAVDTAIQAQAQEDGGAEYRNARRSATGDLNGDGQSDIAAIFTVEVAAYNGYTQYLVVATGQADGTVQWTDTVPVGGRGNEVTGLTIQEGAAKLTSLTLGPEDPDCCPTMEVTTEYLLHNGELRQFM